MPRRRSTRALTNDVAIRVATVDQILRVGVDGLAFRDVARAARLSHGALYARFEDVEELLIDLWSDSLVQRAVSLFESISLAVTSPSKKTVDAVMYRIRHATSEDTVMVKVLWTSRRYTILHEEVESFIHDYLETNRGEMSAALQSRTLVFFSFGLLALFASSQSALDRQDFECFSTTILEALSVPTEDVEPLELSEPIVRGLHYSPDDLQSRLMYHTFLAVGTSGYSRATISRISRRADCSPGAIYKLFPSKEDLVVGAVRTNMQAPWIRVANFATVLDPGNFAQILYSAASAQNSVRKDFALEVVMASAYNDQLRAVVQKILRDVESVIPMIEGLSHEEEVQFRCMIRIIVYAVMGVSYLSTVTKATDVLDFNQFAEPVRQAIVRTLVPSWATIRQQMENIVNSARVLP